VNTQDYPPTRREVPIVIERCPITGTNPVEPTAPPVPVLEDDICSVLGIDMHGVCQIDVYPNHIDVHRRARGDRS